MPDIKSLDDAVELLKELRREALKANRLSMSEYVDGYSRGQFDAFGEALEAITGKPAHEADNG